MRPRRRTCWTWWWSRLSRSDGERVRPPRGVLLFEAAAGGGPGGGAGRGTAKTASMRASFRAIHGARRPRPAPPPGPRTGSGFRPPRMKKEKSGSADPWSAETVRPPFPSIRRPWVGATAAPWPPWTCRRWGGVAVQDRLFAWMRKASLHGRTCGVSCTAAPPRQQAAPQLLTLTLPVTAKDSTCKCRAVKLRPARGPASHDARRRR